MREIFLIKTGLLKYSKAWQLQKKYFALAGQDSASHFMILTEHFPVITIGKKGGAANLLISSKLLEQKGIELFEIDRGGDITFHGPGQIVGYPILNLNDFKKDVHWYLRKLEEVIIQTLGYFGIESGRIAGLTGVWAGNEKVCAIGIKATRWVTMHGFALNVSTDLSYFDYIVPCGISDKKVTSISKILAKPVSIEEVQPILIKNFQSEFDSMIKPVELE